MGGSSGGGSSGKVSWPAHLMSRHSYWMNGLEYNASESERETLEPGVNVEQSLEEAYDESPYDNITGFDPSDELGELKNRIFAFATTLAGIDPQGVWENFVSVAKTQVESILDDDYQDDLVELFEDVQRPTFNRTVSQFTSGMQDINAVQSSAFVFGLANLSRDFNRRIAAYATEIGFQAYKDKLTLITQGVTQLTETLFNKLNMQQTGEHLTAEVSRLSIIAQKEYTDTEAEYTVKDSLWNLDLWQYASNMLAAASGGTNAAGMNTPSKGQSALAGALSGAGLGAMVTPNNPVVGAAAGAAIGGTAGYLMSEG